MTRILFALQILSTFALFGLIWFVQIVHYPLHALVGTPEFARYEAEHADRTGYVAGALMLLELATAAAMLLSRFRSPTIPAAQASLGFALVALLWLCTFSVQVPLHDRLHREHNRTAIGQLIRTNWIRTALWTLRAALIFSWLL